MLTLLPLLATIPIATYAFQNTAPLQAYSNQPLSSLSSLQQAIATNGPVIQAQQALDTLFDASIAPDTPTATDQYCNLDGVLVVDLKGLHASDLPLLLSLLPSSFSSSSSPSETSTLSIPYLLSPSASLASDLALYPFGSTCPQGRDVRSSELGQKIDVESTDASALRVYVVSSGEELVGSVGEERKDEVVWQGTLLATELASFQSVNPHHLIVLTSSLPSSSALTIQRRASTPPSQLPESSPLFTSSFAPDASAPSLLMAAAEEHGPTKNTTGLPLLQRYTILSTPIISALLVSFGLFVPIVGLAVYAVAGIQVPRRMDQVKGIMGNVGEVKKNQ